MEGTSDVLALKMLNHEFVKLDCFERTMPKVGNILPTKQALMKRKVVVDPVVGDITQSNNGRTRLTQKIDRK